MTKMEDEFWGFKNNDEKQAREKLSTTRHSYKQIMFSLSILIH